MTLKDKMSNSVVSSKREKGQWLEQKTNAGEQQIFHFIFRERATSLKFSANPTVGSLRDKKKSCSTRRGLHVGTGFEEF